MKFGYLMNLFKNKKCNKTSEDVPTIIFDNLELQFLFGKWLGIISNNTSLKKFNHDLEKQNEVTYVLGRLLNLIGIDKNEVLTISDCHRHLSVFECCFKNKDEKAVIKLLWEYFSDFGPEFIITSNNDIKYYEYIKTDDTSKSMLRISRMISKNDDGSKKYFRYFLHDSFSIQLECNDYSLSLRVKNVKSNNEYVNNYDVFKVDNEDEIKDYFLNIDFPISIDKLYKDICNLLKDINLDDVSFVLKVNNKIRDKVITDLVSLNKGVLDNFIMTKGDKKVSIDRFGNWSYDNTKIKASKTNGLINYSFQKLSEEEIKLIGSLDKQVNVIDEEVKGVKGLVKSLFQS